LPLIAGRGGRHLAQPFVHSAQADAAEFSGRQACLRLDGNTFARVANFEPHFVSERETRMAAVLLPEWR